MDHRDINMYNISWCMQGSLAGVRGLYRVPVIKELTGGQEGQRERERERQKMYIHMSFRARSFGNPDWALGPVGTVGKP